MHACHTANTNLQDDARMLSHACAALVFRGRRRFRGWLLRGEVSFGSSESRDRQTCECCLLSPTFSFPSTRSPSYLGVIFTMQRIRPLGLPLRYQPESLSPLRSTWGTVYCHAAC